MDLNITNINLKQFNDAICTIIENTQHLENEIKNICNLKGIKQSKSISKNIQMLLEQKFIKEDKKEVVTKIINARNLIVHEFYISNGKCLENYLIKKLSFSNDIEENFKLLNVLIFEVRDHFENIKNSNDNIPNYIDNTYTI